MDRYMKVNIVGAESKKTDVFGIDEFVLVFGGGSFYVAKLAERQERDFVVLSVAYELVEKRQAAYLDLLRSNELWNDDDWDFNLIGPMKINNNQVQLIERWIHRRPDGGVE